MARTRTLFIFSCSLTLYSLLHEVISASADLLLRPVVCLYLSNFLVDVCGFIVGWGGLVFEILRKDSDMSSS